MKIIMMKKIGSHYSLSIKQKSMNIFVKLVQVLNCYMWDTNRIVVFSSMFCFPISDDVIVPQRIVSFNCRLMHVHPCAYVCIINEKTKGNFPAGEHYAVWIGKTKQTSLGLTAGLIQAKKVYKVHRQQKYFFTLSDEDIFNQRDFQTTLRQRVFTVWLASVIWGHWRRQRAYKSSIW